MAAMRSTDSSQRTGAVTWRVQQLAHARGVLIRRRLDVGDDRHLRRLNTTAASAARQPLGGRLHERAMERRAHAEQLRQLRAARLGGRAGAIDGPLVARDHDLTAAVEVRGAHDLAFAACLAGLGAGRLDVGARRGRRSPPSRPTPGATASCMNLPRRLTTRTASARRKRAGRDQRRVLAQRVAGDDVRAAGRSRARARAARRCWS